MWPHKPGEYFLLAEVECCVEGLAEQRLRMRTDDGGAFLDPWPGVCLHQEPLGSVLRMLTPGFHPRPDECEALKKEIKSWV